MSTKDIIDQLHDDARRLRVARKLPDGQLEWEWIERVQSDFKTFKESHALSLDNIAKRLGQGYSPSVLSSFLAMKSGQEYIGDINRITRGLNQFMEQFARTKESPRPAGFVETRVAKRMLSLIQNAIELRAIGVIYGPSGVGKSMTFAAAASIFAGSILIRARSTARTPAPFARQMCDALRLNPSRMSSFSIQSRLIETLKGTDRPVLVDEAHHMGMQSLEFLRDLHDECEIPVVLIGTIDIEKCVSDTSQWYGQFASRTALRYDITEVVGAGSGGSGGRKSKPLFTKEDVIAVFHSDKLRLTDDGVMLLVRLANSLGLGCLRLCRQVVFVAAKTSGGQAIDAELLLRVLRQMHGHVHMTERVERVIREIQAVA